MQLSALSTTAAPGVRATHGIGIPQAVAKIDNCACGGIDKRSSIHSISALTTFKVESS